ncbi:MAG: MFS transporter [Gammaproteobacteria bacterium]|nr:MFS transporter [Gammaproteobacteria bacterium]
MSELSVSPQDNPFRHAGFRRLFAAQAVALAGTGLSTVGLQLLAYRLTGGQAAPVLATALSIKMIAYVFLAPICGGLAHRTSRKSILVASDALRAGLVLLLPLVAAEWQIYLLIFGIQALAAASKPALQAIIPTVLPDQATYMRALSWTRLAYDLETAGSMMLAIALMAAGSGFELLFELNSGAFLLSALLIIFTRLPKAAPAERTGRILDDITFGLRSYMATPRLRALLALYSGAAMVSGAVLVNNVDYVRTALGGADYLVAVTMLAYGAGSMAAALATPLILRRISSRQLVSRGALLAGFAALCLIFSPGLFPALVIWMAMGAGGAWVYTPSGGIINRSSSPADLPAYFSAHFSLSHLAWLASYPLAGWLGTMLGLPAAGLILGLVCIALALAGARLWPRQEQDEIAHEHEAVEHTHKHSHDRHHQHAHQGGEAEEPHSHPHRHPPVRHSHDYVIDLHHTRWPAG